VSREVRIKKLCLWDSKGRSWKDNIKVDLQEVRWGGMDWSDLAQYMDRWRALADGVRNFLVP
jgi:hypothetical protein